MLIDDARAQDVKGQNYFEALLIYIVGGEKPNLEALIMGVKAVGFDFFGTLVEAKANVNDCISSMCTHLEGCGFSFNEDAFLESYRATVHGYRETRNKDLREITNYVWLCDTLNRLDFNIEATDPVIVSTVQRYFDVWETSIYPEVPEVLEKISSEYRTGLVSNFTDSGFLHRTLRKFNLETYFDSIVVSDTVGWRKPHPKIFKRFLDSLKVEPEETVYVGDDLYADIRGALDMGIIAVLILREGDKDLENGSPLPDYTVNSLLELEKILAFH
jgi:putative hydrolase of the HAD superfamily